MILFLTYHRISASRESRLEPEFYTVAQETLAHHLELLIEAGLSPLDASHLKNRAGRAERTCHLSFDDGTVDHHDVVLPLLKRFNLRAVFFVPTAKLDRPGHLSRGQLRKIADAGHTIGCHSHEHKRMDTMESDELRRQLDLSKEILRQETQQEPWIFAPPGGYINRRVRSVALKCGLEAIRTMRWGLNQKPDLTSLETVPLNRHITDEQFRKVLEGKQSRVLYLGKEAAKALVPTPVYERLRALAFRAARKN